MDRDQGFFVFFSDVTLLTNLKVCNNIIFCKKTKINRKSTGTSLLVIDMTQNTPKNYIIACITFN